MIGVWSAVPTGDSMFGRDAHFHRAIAAGGPRGSAAERSLLPYDLIVRAAYGIGTAPIRPFRRSLNTRSRKQTFNDEPK